LSQGTAEKHAQELALILEGNAPMDDAAYNFGGRAQSEAQSGGTMTPEKKIVCTSLPDCPCEFCTDIKKNIQANPQPLRYLRADEEKSLVDDFLREYETGEGGKKK